MSNGTNIFKQGPGLVIFNIILFIVTCISLYLIKKYPQYKIFLIMLVIGIVIVHLHSMLRWKWYQSYIKKLEAAQYQNIVPSYCPDYWVRSTNATGSKCVNEFVVRSDDEDQVKVYKLGDKNTQKEFKLEDYTSLTNQVKCSKFASQNIPWIDVDTKCNAANMLNGLV